MEGNRVQVSEKSRDPHRARFGDDLDNGNWDWTGATHRGGLSASLLNFGPDDGNWFHPGLGGQ